LCSTPSKKHKEGVEPARLDLKKLARRYLELEKIAPQKLKDFQTTIDNSPLSGPYLNAVYNWWGADNLIFRSRVGLEKFHEKCDGIPAVKAYNDMLQIERDKLMEELCIWK
jgi:hypothetical protein